MCVDYFGALVIILVRHGRKPLSRRVRPAGYGRAGLPPYRLPGDRPSPAISEPNVKLSELHRPASGTRDKGNYHGASPAFTDAVMNQTPVGLLRITPRPTGPTHAGSRAVL